MKQPRDNSGRFSSSKEEKKIHNVGLAEAVGFQQNGYSGQPFGVQLSQTETLFRNNRWYLISNMRQLLSELYVEHGLIQTIVDVPVDDAFRGGVEISSKQLDEDQIEELQICLDRKDDLTVAAQGEKWNRLFGGGGILLITDQDPTTPFDISSISEGDNIEFRALDLWELFWDRQAEGDYNVQTQEDEYEFYNYYGHQVHKSRVFQLKGLTAPSFIRPRLRGWGFSIIEHLVRSINQYLKANDLTFEVLDEFKVDVFKIKNLTNTLMSPNGAAQVSKRIQLANFQKNYQNALIMDGEDDFDHKDVSFTGLAEVMREIRMQIASDMRMPLTKLFGISAAGFNSGEDDIEVYNSMVEGQVRKKIKYDVLRMIEIRCQQLFGFVPDDLQINFKPLRVLNSVDEETVKSQKFTRLAQARSMGEITTFEFRESCNRDKLLGIKLDTAGDKLNLEDPEALTVIEKKGIAGDANPDEAEKAA